MQSIYMTEQDEMNLLGAGAPAMLRHLQSREAVALKKVYATFKAGQDLLAVTAEWVALRDLSHDFERRLAEREQKGI